MLETFFLMTLILWLAGMLGQFVDIFFNFGKVGEDIRKSDGTPFTEETSVISIFIFYLRSRRISIFVTTCLLVMFAAIMAFDGITLLTLNKYNLFTMLGFGYGGQQAMRDALNIKFKKDQA